MSKLHTIDITLEDGKELVGVRTSGNTVTVVYSVENQYRPIGFIHYGDIQDDIEKGEDEDIMR